MKEGWLLILTAWLILLHHYQKHMKFYDPNDLKALKLKSHEFWLAVCVTAGLILLALE